MVGNGRITVHDLLIPPSDLLIPPGDLLIPPGDLLIPPGDFCSRHIEIALVLLPLLKLAHQSNDVVFRPARKPFPVYLSVAFASEGGLVMYPRTLM